MMAWTDKHCRYFHRLITRNALLYTEMVSTGALLHGDLRQHLRFDETEHPVALQLGGSEPLDLARAAKIGEQWGYDEINLNCGCPSVRVQRGAFGACLMAEPALVADGVKAMLDAVEHPRDGQAPHRHRPHRELRLRARLRGAGESRPAARSSSSTRAMPGWTGSARRKTATSRRCATSWPTS